MSCPPPDQWLRKPALRLLQSRCAAPEEGRQLPRITCWLRSETDTSIVTWRRAVEVLASTGGNDVTTTISRLIETSPELSVVSLRALANKALHRGSDTIQT